MITDTNLKEAALTYAAKGFKVFPLISGSKVPATEHGNKEATHDAETIEGWWNKNPSYNIGIATGNGLVVIDVDENHGTNSGSESLRTFEAAYGQLPDTLTCYTPHGGKHMYYYADYDIHNAVGVLPAVDVRANGGYVVAPPSVIDGVEYTWEDNKFDSQRIGRADDTVLRLLNEPIRNKNTRIGETKLIHEGNRTNFLMSLLGSMQAHGISDETIRQAIKTENGLRCNPPIAEQELERTVFSALSRFEKGSVQYDISSTDISEEDLPLVSLANVEEREQEWLIPNVVPKGEITILAGDGGVGKSFLWCSIAAAVSTGNSTIFEADPFSDMPQKVREPATVLIASAEDSLETVLHRRLRKNMADMKNILSVPDDTINSGNFYIGSTLLEKYISKYKPALCVLDPIQAFLPPDINMSSRAAMRNVMKKLHQYGTDFGTSFLIVMHTNKLQKAFGRARLSDSSDIWDIARSVLIAGKTPTRGISYVSHEKSNYGSEVLTALFSVQEDLVVLSGTTELKDQDYVTMQSMRPRSAEKVSAEDFIRDYLRENGAVKVTELSNAAVLAGISANALRNAKKSMKEDGTICLQLKGNGDKKGVDHYLILNTEPNEGTHIEPPVTPSI